MAERDEYTNFLTLELREHFHFMGYEVVERDMLNHHYSAREKRMAALAWLDETRRKEKREAAELQRRSVEVAEQLH